MSKGYLLISRKSTFWRIPIAPPASAYESWPDSSVARNVARLYALIARDIRSGTRSAPSFRDAVALHEVIDAIDRSAAGKESK